MGSTHYSHYPYSHTAIVGKNMNKVLLLNDCVSCLHIEGIALSLSLDQLGGLAQHCLTTAKENLYVTCMCTAKQPCRNGTKKNVLPDTLATSVLAS